MRMPMPQRFLFIGLEWRKRCVFSITQVIFFLSLRCNSYIIKFSNLKCTIQWFQYIHKVLIPAHFITPNRNSIPISSHSLFPFLSFPPTPSNTSLLSVSMDLPILYISYKWNHTIQSFVIDFI